MTTSSTRHRLRAVLRSRATLTLLLLATGLSAADAQVRWSAAVLRQRPEWYASETARSIADSVLQYQSPQGGWPKSTDLAVPPRTPEDVPPPGRGRANSIDNEATTLPMEFLARVVHATGEERYRASFLRGVDYLLAAQYPNGGWPQFFPLRGDYYSHITYNDGAMSRVLTLLRDTAAGEPPYSFVDAQRRRKAGAAVQRGVDCILKTQIKQDGKLTVWCAQHDEKTLAPAWARKYEPASLSGSESVGVVRFLMSIEHPTPEVVAAVEGAVTWFQTVVLKGVRVEETPGADGRTDRRLVVDLAAPPLWARFYELGTNRPLYLDRDSVFRYDFAEIGIERRSGYAYHGEWAASLLLRDYPAWRTRHTPPEVGPLRVSDNGRYLQYANGQPFFWLADTSWLLSQKLSREEVKAYFENRKAKGFNVVQCVVVQTLADESVYGDSALIGGDISKLRITPGSDPADPEQYDYWDHVEYIIDTAAANGITLAITPTWSHTVRRAPITKEQAALFAAALAERLKHKPNLVWLNGGSARGNENADVWQAIGETIKKHDPVHLMSFHPFGRAQSSTWFSASAWLDFNMFTSGHRRYDQDDTGKKYGEDNWRYVLEDLGQAPRKPTIDGEPAYEDTPQGLHDGSQPYWTDNDVRRYAYWSVFAGAAGHTYGQNSVRQVYMPRDTKPASGAKGTFAERLEAPGATQMRHLKDLVLSRPYFDRVNDRSVVAGDEGERYDRVLVTRGKGFLFAYTYTGRSFTLTLTGGSGSDLQAWWFNPRTGAATRAGIHKAPGAVAFDPPGDPANGNDWVLVLDDVASNFNPPGVGIAR